MKRKRFTEAQIVGVLNELGTETADVCRKHGAGYLVKRYQIQAQVFAVSSCRIYPLVERNRQRWPERRKPRNQPNAVRRNP